MESVAMARAHSWGQRSPAGLSGHFRGPRSLHRPTSPRRRGSGISMVARISVSVGDVVELTTACLAGNLSLSSRPASAKFPSLSAITPADLVT